MCFVLDLCACEWDFDVHCLLELNNQSGFVVNLLEQLKSMNADFVHDYGRLSPDKILDAV